VFTIQVLALVALALILIQLGHLLPQQVLVVIMLVVAVAKAETLAHI
jgi:hypothetical protein